MIVEFTLLNKLRVLVNVARILYYEEAIAGMKVYIDNGTILETTTDYQQFRMSFTKGK